MDTDPTQRFSDRAENYARYRPGYPPAVLDCLRDECGLSSASVIADVGSGTGILTRVFLEHGNTVYAVEPNGPMRAAAERWLAGYPGFVSVDGRAEATTLADHSVDFVTAGQAFHWFDAAQARVEFQRILRPEGWVALVWNARQHEGDPLMAAYERVLEQFGMGYHVVTHRSHDDDMGVLFVNGYESRTFSLRRPLDFDAFWGGFLSASYAPRPGDAIYEPMHDALQTVFDRYAEDGRVTFVYDTNLFYGRL